MRHSAIIIALLIWVSCVNSNETSQDNNSDNSAMAENVLDEAQLADQAHARGLELVTGPDKFVASEYKILEGKRVGVVANHTALVNNGTHLVDTLVSLGVKVKMVFAPEHGFRGTADAGEHVANGVDTKTGLPIISLYGKNRKPTSDQMNQLDVIVFDIQDIGSRHYTYIGTMTYVMQACAEVGKPFIVLDRPNPNGWYVDGPVLEEGNNSFIGMHEVPIVHGMTIGEYAMMVNEEGWLGDGLIVDLSVIQCEGYYHGMRWDDTGLSWTPPSPNIGTEYAAYLYPAICWFEPTPVSVGRGTDEAFTIVGAPWYKLGGAEARANEDGLNYYGLEMDSYTFTPVSLPGKSKDPKFQDEECQGLAFKNRVDGKSLFLAGLLLLSDMYQQHQANFPKEEFFKKSFYRWPGNKSLRLQIIDGVAPETIYESWQEKVEAFKEIREKYLLYPA